MILYMAVTADEYELPIAVMEKPGDLAEAFEIHKSYLFELISRGGTNKRNKTKFLKIEVDK